MAVISEAALKLKLKDIYEQLKAEPFDQLNHISQNAEQLNQNLQRLITKARDALKPITETVNQFYESMNNIANQLRPITEKVLENEIQRIADDLGSKRSVFKHIANRCKAKLGLCNQHKKNIAKEVRKSTRFVYYSLKAFEQLNLIERTIEKVRGIRNSVIRLTPLGEMVYDVLTKPEITEPVPKPIAIEPAPERKQRTESKPSPNKADFKSLKPVLDDVIDRAKIKPKNNSEPSDTEIKIQCDAQALAFWHTIPLTERPKTLDLISEELKAGKMKPETYQILIANYPGGQAKAKANESDLI